MFTNIATSPASPLQVEASGDVSPPNNAGGFTAYLDGIVFRCGPHGQNGCP